MAWKFVLTDSLSANYAPLGEITRVADETKRELSLPLNGLPTANFTLRLDDPLAAQITDRDGDVLLKVYQGSTLRFIGDLTNAEEVGGDQGQTLACNFAGPLWRLQKRLIGKHVQGRGFTETDAAQIVRSLLDEANAEQGVPSTGSDTGIREGTLDVLYNTSAGIETPWRFKPIAEALTELQASKVPFPLVTPPSYYIRDTFSSGTVVQARTPDTGSAWACGGNGPDWDLVGGIAHRLTSGGESPVGGRWAVSTTADHGPCLAGADYQSTVRSQAGINLSFCLYTSLNGQTNTTVESGDWLRLLSEWGATDEGRFRLQKKISGTITDLGTFNVSAPGYLNATTSYSIRILRMESGGYQVYHYETGQDPGAPIFSGTLSELATGGALDTGTIAFHDNNTNSPSTYTTWDNVFASDYTGPQSFDFEFAPVEPVVDTYTINLGPGPITYDGLKLASMNIRYRIGTDKPEVIFEYGGGNRSAKQYRRAINREGLLTQSYSLPTGFPEDTDILGADDPTAIAARGRFEEVVPSDVQDDQLRQALAIYHVRVRKQAQHIVAFEPSSTAPVFGDGATEYKVGDSVTARAIVNGSVRFNGLVRVYQVDVSIDENGKEDVIPTLVSEAT